jgi:hypothetical protein
MAMTRLVFRCLLPHNAVPAQSASSQQIAASSATSELAIKTSCHAYWVGAFIQESGRTVRQWETKAQYRSGAGHVAKIQHSANGYRVADCNIGAYGHG